MEKHLGFKIVFAVMLFIGLLSLCTTNVFADGKESAGEIVSINPSGGDDGKDFNNEPQFTGDVSFPVFLATIGGVEISLQYNSNVHKQIRSDNRVAPSGGAGFGWSLNIGSIMAEINNTAEVFDDKYYYVDGEGSTEIIQTASGEFKLKQYKPWKITRVINSGYVIGWEIIKEDGTKFRFGNYVLASSQFSLSYTPTYATRCYLGFSGIVENARPADYSSAQYVPYQWDISDVEDIYGNHTSIIYQQVQLVLNTGSYYTTLYYTRESHPYKILDNTGGEIEFVLGDMATDEYDGDTESYRQNIFEKKYLQQLKLKQNGVLFKQIVLSHQAQDILNIKAKKKYLTGIAIQDAAGKSLPVKTFEYCGATEVNPGALKRIISPSGSKVEYSYKAQALTNVQLSQTSAVPGDPFNGLLPGSLPHTGMAGKDFYVLLNSAHFFEDQCMYGAFGYPPIQVYRLGTTGWYLDTSFPVDSAYYYYVGNDYVVVDGRILVKRAGDGWVTYDLVSAIEQAGGIMGEWGYQDVIGGTQSYFVLKHNSRQIADGNLNNISVIRFVPNGIAVDRLSGDYKDYYKLNPGERFDIKADCAENYFIITSFEENGEGQWDKGYYDTHFKFRGVSWINMMNKRFVEIFAFSDCSLIDKPTLLPQHAIGKNFIACMYYQGNLYGSHTVVVYDATGDHLVTLDSVTNLTNYSDCFVTDNYYGVYNSRINYGNQFWIKTWNGSSFSSKIFLGDIFPQYAGSNFERQSLTPVGDKIVFIGLKQPGGGGWDSTILGVTKFSPASGFSGSKILEARPYRSVNAFSTAITENSFVVEWRDDILDHYCALKSYNFIGDSILFSAAVDSFSVWNNGALINRFWQPMQNFIASLKSPDLINQYDSTTAFSLANDVNGNITFNGNPYDYVVEKKTVFSGMGDSLVATFKFENGVYDETFTTAKYNKVTVTPPGSIGKTVTYFYNDLGSGQAEDFIDVPSYTELDGLPYRTKAFSSNNTVVSQTINTWGIHTIDATNGIFHQRLIQSRDSIDGVIKNTNYEYNNVNMEVSKITEDVDAASDLSGLRDKETYISYAFQQAQYSSMASANMLSQVYQRVQWAGPPWTPPTFLSMEQTDYDANGLYLRSQVSADGAGNWITTDSVASRNSYGRVTQSDNVDKVRTSTLYGYNSTVPVGTAVNANLSQLFVDDFEDGNYAGWITLDKYAVGNTVWSVENRQLKIVNYVSTRWNEFDRITYNLPSELGGSTAVEFDLRIAETSSFDLIIGIGGDQWQGQEWLGSEMAVWSAIENENWEYATGVWNLIKPGLTVGATYHFKIVVNPYPVNTVDYYVDGVKMVANAPTRQSTTGVQKIVFGRYGMSSLVSTWYIDNFRVYPAGALVTTATYDPVTLQTTSSTDASGISTYYDYDGFGRLTATKNTDKSIITQQAYYYSREGNSDLFEPNDPNFVETMTYPNGLTTNGLAAYYTMEGSINDASGTGNNGGAPSGVAYGRGSRGRAFNTTGNKYLLITNSSSLSPANITVEAWVKPTSLGSTQFVAGKGNGSSGCVTPYGIDIVSDGRVRMEIYAANGSYYDAITTSAITAGAWSHIAATYDGTIIRIYINGSQAGSLTTNAGSLAYGSWDGNVTIGKKNDGGYPLYLTGFIDEVRIYNRALSPGEISANANFSVATAYSDGIGRTLQTQTREGANDLVSAVEYDNAGRQYRTWRPYSYGTGHTFDNNATSSSRATSVFGISNPYSERKFYSDPLSRDSVAKIAGQTTTDEEIRYRYSSETVDGNQPCTYVESKKRMVYNLPWMISRTYTDRLGRTIKTEQYQDGGGGDTITSRAYYTIRGQVYQEVSPKNYSSTNTYNFLGQLTQKNDPDEGLSYYMYDKAGRLRFMVDAVGLLSGNDKILYWKYDALGRVKEKGYFYDRDWTALTAAIANDTIFPTSAMTANYWRKRYQYGTSGRLEAVYTNNDDASDSEVDEFIVYDKFGNATRKDLKVHDYNSGTTYMTYYGYDLLGRVTSIQYPSATGLTTNYAYDMAGRITAVKDQIGYELASYTYNAKTEMQAEVFKYGAQTRTFSYDTQGRLWNIGSPSFYSEALSYSTAGADLYYHGLIAQATTSYGSAVASPPSPYTQNFAYDKYGRLTQATGGGYSDQNIGASNPTDYDANGNMRWLERGGTYRNYKYKPGKNTIDSVGSWKYNADATGNITASGSIGGNWTISHDPFTQMPMQYTQSTQAVYLQYDGKKERVYKQYTNTGGMNVKTLYLHGLNDYPLVIKDNNNNEWLYVYGPTGLIWVKANGTPYYIHKDHLGSTKLVVDMENDQAVCRYEYDPYGKIVDAYVNPQTKYLFTNQEQESDINTTSFWNFRARAYDSEIGLFYATDPAKESYSPYGYVLGNPISFIDPTGRETEEARRIREEEERIKARKAYLELLNLRRESHQLWAQQYQNMYENSSTFRASADAMRIAGVNTARQGYYNFIKHSVQYAAWGPLQEPVWQTDVWFTSDWVETSASWMGVAEGEIGQKEVRGVGNNPRILEYHRATSLKAKSDATPWCSSFANWTVKQVNIQGTNSASALSWSKWGQELNNPAFGSLAIIDWGGGKGHVGFVAGVDENGSLIILGGNQSDQVKYSTFSTSSFSGYVYPSGLKPSYSLPVMNINGSGSSYAETR